MSVKFADKKIFPEKIIFDADKPRTNPGDSLIFFESSASSVLLVAISCHRHFKIKKQILKVSENIKKFPRTREIPRNPKNVRNQNMSYPWGDTSIGLPLAGSVYMHTQSYICISTCQFLTAN